MIRLAIKIRIHPIKRRSPSQRLHARLYYRRNKVRIRMKRKRYMRTHKTLLKHRKMFQRFKPKWFRHPTKPATPHKPHKFKKFKVVVPKMFRLHVPKKVIRHG